MTSPSDTGRIVAVIVSKDTRDATLRCVRSVLAQRAAGSGDGVGALDLAVVVVDNASADGTAAAVRAEFGACVTVIANEQNRGFGTACNAGASTLPDAAWILILNADVVLDPDAVAVLLAAAEADPRAAVLGPRFTFPGGRAQSSIRGDPTRSALLYQHTAARYLRIGRRAYSQYKSPFDGAVPQLPCAVPVTLGACLLVRGEVFRKLGGFDERYFLYFEEADLERRARRGGFVVLHVPAAHVDHEGGASSDRDRERALRWYLASLFLYADRFHGRAAGLWYRAVFKPLFVAKMLVDVLRDVAAILFRRKRAKAAEVALGVRFLTRGIWSFLVA